MHFSAGKYQELKREPSKRLLRKNRGINKVRISDFAASKTSLSAVDIDGGNRSYQNDAMATSHFHFLLFLTLFAGSSYGNGSNAIHYFDWARSFYRQGKYEKCIQYSSMFEKQFPTQKKAQVLLSLCKEWLELSKAKEKHPTKEGVNKKIDVINQLVQSNVTCETDNDCIDIEPQECGGYRYYHWALSRKNENIDELNLRINDLWRSAAWMTGKQFFTCEAKGHAVYCKSGVCSEL